MFFVESCLTSHQRIFIIIIDLDTIEGEVLSVLFAEIKSILVIELRCCEVNLSFIGIACEDFDIDRSS